MGAIESARRAVDTLGRNPVIFAGAAFIALLSLPTYALQTTELAVFATAYAGVAFFVSPFLTGGVLGMADEGLEGRTGFSTFVSSGRSHYVSLLLVAILVTIVIAIVAAIGALVIVGIAIAALGISPGGLDVGTGSLAVLGVLVLGYVLVLVVLALVFQFANPAVVVDDVGPIDALTQSYRTVRGNLLGAIGVGVFAFLLGGVLAGIPVTAASLAVQPGPADIPIPLTERAAYAIMFGWGTVSTILFNAFNNTMFVAFYEAYAPSP